MPRKKKDEQPAQEKREEFKPRCPFLSSIGEKDITCTDSFCLTLGKKEFGSKKDCRNKVDSHCYDRFYECEDYRKYYDDQNAKDTPGKTCLHCCNNSWYTGLPAGYDGQKYCFCQIKQEPMLHKDSCEWFNRHPGWDLSGRPCEKAEEPVQGSKNLAS